VALSPTQQAQAAAAKKGTDGKTAAAAASSAANQGVGSTAKPAAGANSASPQGYQGSGELTRVKLSD